jgi:predicted AlkP superfamily pyrophosphatase or phosphodiesterase
MQTKLTSKAWISFSLIVALTFAFVPVTSSQQAGGKTRLVLVFVVDGLRPDSINAEDTPTIDRLRREGVSYVNSRCVFPSVTRVNTAAISTGTYPQRNGIVSNVMFHPGVYPNKPFNTGEWKDLLALAAASKGQMLFTRSLAQRLTERGIRFAAVSSGSTGNAILLNHTAPSGTGILVNGNFEPGKRVAFPDAVNSEILQRFGKAPAGEDSALLDWTDRVLREYILPVHKPEVVIDWLTEPDGAQHQYGVGSKEARDALRNSDRNIGLTLQKVVELGYSGSTDVFVLSDHGFSWHNYGVNLSNDLVTAGLKKSADSDDLVIASNGQSVFLYIKNHDQARTASVVRFLEQQSWVDVIFTRGKVPLKGTFPLELVHQANPERAPDILFTLQWDSASSTSGVPGTHYTTVSGKSGPMSGTSSGHGGMSAWSMRNTAILWGSDFRRGTAIRLPASNVDVAPTIMALLGLPGLGELDGRVLSEAFVNGPDPEKIHSGIETHRLRNGSFESIVEIETLAGARYVVKGWRSRPEKLP